MEKEKLNSYTFLLCVLRRTFLTGESPQSTLVVGRIQSNIKKNYFVADLVWEDVLSDVPYVISKYIIDVK